MPRRGPLPPRQGCPSSPRCPNTRPRWPWARPARPRIRAPWRRRAALAGPKASADEDVLAGHGGIGGMAPAAAEIAADATTAAADAPAAAAPGPSIRERPARRERASSAIGSDARPRPAANRPPPVADEDTQKIVVPIPRPGEPAATVGAGSIEAPRWFGGGRRVQAPVLVAAALVALAL